MPDAAKERAKLFRTLRVLFFLVLGVLSFLACLVSSGIILVAFFPTLPSPAMHTHMGTDIAISFLIINNLIWGYFFWRWLVRRFWLRRIFLVTLVILYVVLETAMERLSVTPNPGMVLGR
jgi:hypothetical protein